MLTFVKINLKDTMHVFICDENGGIDVFQNQIQEFVRFFQIQQIARSPRLPYR
jgi:hypothetical protein